MRISVQHEPFDFRPLKARRLLQGTSDMGAIVTFTGIVRDLPDDPMDAMEIEHYPGDDRKSDRSDGGRRQNAVLVGRCFG